MDRDRYIVRKKWKAYIEYRQAARQGTKDRAVKLLRKLKNVPCARCRRKFPYYVMDFDHKGGKVKALSRMNNVSVVKILEEAKKCDVVCANCHRIRTFKRKQHLSDRVP